MGTHHQGPRTEILALDAYIKLMRAADSVTARAHLVLPAGQVGVEHGHTAGTGALRHAILALVGLVQMKGGGIDDAKHLCACGTRHVRRMSRSTKLVIDHLI
jgi:hypothetical protein